MRPVVGEQYICRNEVKLTMEKNRSIKGFEIKNDRNELMFTVKGKHFTLHSRRILFDVSGNPILTFKKEISMRSDWKVYKGESDKPEDLLFSVRRSSLIQIDTELDVFLGRAASEGPCDLQINDNWYDKTCEVYAETNKSTIIAKPGVDCAFIIAILVIRKEFKDIGEKMYDGVKLVINLTHLTHDLTQLACGNPGPLLIGSGVKLVVKLTHLSGHLQKGIEEVLEVLQKDGDDIDGDDIDIDDITEMISQAFDGIDYIIEMI